MIIVRIFHFTFVLLTDLVKNKFRVCRLTLFCLNASTAKIIICVHTYVFASLLIIIIVQFIIL